MQTPKFAGFNPEFYADLRKRVQYYFEQSGISHTGNWKLYTKATILFLTFIGLYAHLVFFTPPGWLALLECVLLGGNIAAIGFNIMHDGAHGSFSSSHFWNKTASYTLNMLGGSSFMWNMKHNVIHHTYTNVEGIDDDIDIQPWMRMSHGQPRLAGHRYQHLYFWVLYAFLYIIWVFFMDYQKYFSRRIGKLPLQKMKWMDHFVFWGAKVFFLAFFVILPILQVGFLAWLFGFLVMTLFAGFTLSLVFQLAHTVEDTKFPLPDQSSGKIENDWAIHQIQTTANFATSNKLISWLCGGLNFQIEHHLFPKVSHIHYPAISRIIRETCREYGLAYIEYPRFLMAVASHVSYLRNLGRA